MRDKVEIEHIHADHPQWKELLEIARNCKKKNAEMMDSIINIAETQGDTMSLLEELKPLRSLPEISNNLTKIVEKVVDNATKVKPQKDWISVILVVILAALLILVIFKSQNFEGSFNIFDGVTSFKNNQEKKTNQ